MTQETDDLIASIKEEEDVFSKASQIASILKEKNLKIIDLAKKLSLTSSYICHLLRLNKLPEIIVDSYYSKSINISHLFILSRINNQEKMLFAFEEILKKNLTVYQTEELVREYLYGIKTKGSHLRLKVKEEIVKKFLDKYPEANIKIIQTRVKGKIIIEIKGDLMKTSRIISDITNQLVIR
jgi:hypothetical protein